MAVSIGPGATFWMILAGLLGMASQIYGMHARREVSPRERGRHHFRRPMYYLSRGFADLGKPGLGRALAAIFSVCCIGRAIGGGNMFQANQAAHAQIANVTGGDASFFADRAG